MLLISITMEEPIFMLWICINKNNIMIIKIYIYNDKPVIQRAKDDKPVLIKII